ncbi:MAG TPA: 2-C-methyl-D-erythritol 2,4-cyclodiphosphate synthase [Syntrophales bacterium]|nr:2-C-methyl-D-erythritol 2,4-cyclodiphosphate synthase [Syntrophales bacterium]HOL58680.1 2-C-methyl-D-erythritol 2,4-cyclodiphosphate synthase [Syntrophales bacterium]HPO35032.1 2-C-methyl-D-erythritol 2,4-cyclodiphosphate synthase [Syntrophales bacterium]
MWRVGIGYDSHRLVDNRPLILGGVSIPYRQGLQGHSDADVLVHAIGDAILGAVGAPDIGSQFPDTDPAYRDISSLVLLKRIREIAEERGYGVSNVDAVVVMERPKISPYLNQMKKNIALVLGMDEKWLGIKAKTNEGMGFVGRGEGVYAIAVVIVAKKVERDS